MSRGWLWVALFSLLSLGGTFVAIAEEPFIACGESAYEERRLRARSNGCPFVVYVARQDNSCPPCTSFRNGTLRVAFESGLFVGCEVVEIDGDSKLGAAIRRGSGVPFVAIFFRDREYRSTQTRLGPELLYGSSHNFVLAVEAAKKSSGSDAVAPHADSSRGSNGVLRVPNSGDRSGVLESRTQLPQFLEGATR